MNNFFLLNEAVEVNNFTQFKLGFSELLVIEREIDDSFMKHETVWDLPIIAALFSNFGQEEQAISKFIEQLKTVDNYINCEVVFDNAFQYMSNAFLGVDFSNTTISGPKQIINASCYQQFKIDTLWDVTFRNFWSKKHKLFPNLSLCGEVEEQISRLGNSGHFNQVVERLKEFNSAVLQWSSGEFNFREINKQFALRISPESQQTMSKYGNERLFRLPSGETEYFELHIKTGDLRFHFFPNPKDRKVYVGYIGPHLSTISN